MELETEIERVSNLWNDWIEQNGIGSVTDRRKNVQKQIDEILSNLTENNDLKENTKLLYHAKLLTGMYFYTILRL